MGGLTHRLRGFSVNVVCALTPHVYPQRIVSQHRGDCSWCHPLGETTAAVLGIDAGNSPSHVCYTCCMTCCMTSDISAFTSCLVHDVCAPHVSAMTNVVCALMPHVCPQRIVIPVNIGVIVANSLLLLTLFGAHRVLQLVSPSWGNDCCTSHGCYICYMTCRMASDISAFTSCLVHDVCAARVCSLHHTTACKLAYQLNLSLSPPVLRAELRAGPHLVRRH